MFSGVVLIVDWQELFKSGELKMKFVIKDCEEDIDDLKYSPDGTMLAVGSHDNFVDIYDVWVEEKWQKVMKYQRKWRLKGHTSYITHLDWSKDGRIVQSNCGAYEILYWDIKRGVQIRRYVAFNFFEHYCMHPSRLILLSNSNRRHNSHRSTLDSLEADTDWKTWTCVLGFPVMGIWDPESDGTDVNSVDVCKRRQLIVTADDFGGVNLMRWPAVAKSAAKKVNFGHAAHVMNVRFTCDDGYVISVGGKDRAIMLWKLNRNDHLEDKQAPPKPRLATKWKPQGGWDNGRELEGVGPAWAMTDQFANESNPRAMGWVNKQQKDGTYKMILQEPEKPYGDYKGRYNDHSSSRA
jgi:WD40 repeat protein